MKQLSLHTDETVVCAHTFLMHIVCRFEFKMAFAPFFVWAKVCGGAGRGHGDFCAISGGLSSIQFDLYMYSMYVCL